MSTSLPCSACLTGSVHSGTPAGVETTIHGLNAYVASPADGKQPRGVVVMIPDAFGWRMVNNRLLCDRYAAEGNWLVYLPDFMDGSALPEAFMALSNACFAPSSWPHTLFVKPFLFLRAASMGVPPVIRIRASVCQPRILSFFQKMRSSPPPFPTANLKIGVAGFCWGGQFTVVLAKDLPETRVDVSNENSKSVDGAAGKARLIDCAFTAHPALLKIPDIEKVSVPLSVSIGVVDEWMNTKDIAQMKKILDAKTDAAGECQCVLLEGAKHGFAVRSWEGDKVQMGFADVAEKQALEWFEKWMG